MNTVKQKRKVEVSLECSRNTSPPLQAWLTKVPHIILYVTSTDYDKQVMATLKVA